jgi:hypothetical protein
VDASDASQIERVAVKTCFEAAAATRSRITLKAQLSKSNYLHHNNCHLLSWNPSDPPTPIDALWSRKATKQDDIQAFALSCQITSQPNVILSPWSLDEHRHEGHQALPHISLSSVQGALGGPIGC